STTLLPRQLRTTLFPYTTLFRSKKRGAPRLLDEYLFCLALSRLAAGAPILSLVMRGVSLESRSHTYTSKSQMFVQVEQRPKYSSDRKSTRLNSSHVSISYAVFCL